MTIDELQILLNRLIAQGRESEIVEFKENFHSKEEIGQRISALSNSACLLKQPFAYLLFGIKDGSLEIVGTTFSSKSEMVGNEELEVWLLNRLKPRIDFQSFDFISEKGKNIVLYRIPAAESVPVRFINEAYIRINSSTRKLNDYPEKEKQIWKNELSDRFLSGIARRGLKLSEIPMYLSIEQYFDLIHLPHPQTLDGAISRLSDEGIVQDYEGSYSITNLGALLLGKNLRNFSSSVSRKAIRAIKYKGTGKIETEREYTMECGYCLGFVDLINWINGQLPANEQLERQIREEERMYPPIAIRELVANCIIHQDFLVKGWPTIEIYTDRIEISNPGNPIIPIERFIDGYTSRNDRFADIMRRMGFCEEKGSGMDKAIYYIERSQLPPLNVSVQENKTTVTIYAHKDLNKMSKEERINACYQHTCLKYVSNDTMTNQSLRERFSIADKNASIASRIIKETLESERIKEEDPDSTSRKFKKYIPFWA